METRIYKVFYTIGSHQKSLREFRGIGVARKAAKRVAINELVTHIHIVGYDRMAHESFREIIR